MNPRTLLISTGLVLALITTAVRGSDRAVSTNLRQINSGIQQIKQRTSTAATIRQIDIAARQLAATRPDVLEEGAEIDDALDADNIDKPRPPPKLELSPRLRVAIAANYSSLRRAVTDCAKQLTTAAKMREPITPQLLGNLTAAGDNLANYAQDCAQLEQLARQRRRADFDQLATQLAAPLG